MHSIKLGYCLCVCVLLLCVMCGSQQPALGDSEKLEDGKTNSRFSLAKPSLGEMRRWSIQSLWSSVDLSQQEQRWLEVRLIDRKQQQQQQNVINISINAFPEICWPFVQGAACDD